MGSRLQKKRSPTRRAILEQGAWLASAMVLHGASRAQDAARKERPNLVFLCSDQQHFQALGCADPFFQTPELDRFASEALVVQQTGGRWRDLVGRDVVAQLSCLGRRQVAPGELRFDQCGILAKEEDASVHP